MGTQLEGQVAFITGGASGLGAAAAARLAADGAIVVVNDLDAAAASDSAARFGGIGYGFDVTDSAAFDAAVDDTVARLGRLDIMVNNAGIAPANASSKMQRSIDNAGRRMAGDIASLEPMDNLVDLSDADWDRMIRVHLYGAFHGTRAALRHIQQRRHTRRSVLAAGCGREQDMGVAAGQCQHLRGQVLGQPMRQCGAVGVQHLGNPGDGRGGLRSRRRSCAGHQHVHFSTALGRG